MKILIVIPCYNEEEVLPKTLDVLGALIRKLRKRLMPTQNCCLSTMAVVTILGR